VQFAGVDLLQAVTQHRPVVLIEHIGANLDDIIRTDTYELLRDPSPIQCPTELIASADADNARLDDVALSVIGAAA
jgi:hypothetical protein